jgi:hypothetical protein
MQWHAQLVELFEKVDITYHLTIPPLNYMVFHGNIRKIFVALVSCQDTYATPSAI